MSTDNRYLKLIKLKKILFQIKLILRKLLNLNILQVYLTLEGNL